MKVRLRGYTSLNSLEYSINKFLENLNDEDILDIKLTSTFGEAENGDKDDLHTAMIIYKEDK